jgi:IclR family acetate operon transcriptional repressor
MPRTGRPAIRHVAAVERALALLDALAGGAAELGTNELARRTGINASTVSRLLATLAEAGFVQRVEESGRYRLGIRLLQLGNVVVARLDLREVARPQLESLAEATGETATLSAPGEHAAVTVDFVQSAASVQSVARLGRPSVAHATATGKVLLAFGNATLPEGLLERFTERTIVGRRELEAELARVRERGFADAVREREDDLNALAAPLRGSRGELVAIVGIQGPASRFGKQAMRAAVPALLGAARSISEALGWADPSRKEAA